MATWEVLKNNNHKLNYIIGNSSYYYCYFFFEHLLWLMHTKYLFNWYYYMYFENELSSETQVQATCSRWQWRARISTQVVCLKVVLWLTSTLPSSVRSPPRTPYCPSPVTQHGWIIYTRRLCVCKVGIIFSTSRAFCKEEMRAPHYSHSLISGFLVRAP